ncbi:MULTISPECIES: nucleotidyltransferase family protein [unclassified Thalassospira]|uniref:nucleotidyltransferase family protein n=1 Tax=unclassified Thalassospira TaxID=2648997 RepID=UPI0009CF1C9E|nr:MULTISPECIES: nucleotidyltransferase family protein [unclassified Thalassospira]ONH88635.1 alcohol dehydrogenase [Thalassospira sp. MCCC 1A02803]
MKKDFTSLLISKTATVMDAIKAIDAGGKQVAFVTAENNKLTGSVTDGDIRRGLLQGISLSDPVEKVMKTNPVHVKHDNWQKWFVLDLMKTDKVHQIPVIDDDGCIVSISSIDDLLEQPEPNNTWVVIMAGGLGTRLRPLTHDVPKPMLPVGGRPLLESIIRNFVAQGYRKFFLSVNYKADIVEKHFEDGTDFGADIRYLHENKRLGTAGALSLLPERPDAPVIVMNGDLLTTVNFDHLLQFHNEHQAEATICGREYQQQVPYGVLKTENSYLTQIVEKPSTKYLVNSGIYVVSPDALELIPKNTYFDMPQLFELLLKQDKRTVVFPMHEYWLDIGQFKDLEKAQTEFELLFGSES